MSVFDGESDLRSLLNLSEGEESPFGLIRQFPALMPYEDQKAHNRERESEAIVDPR